MGEKPQKICRRSSIEPGGCGDGCAGHRGGQAGTHRYPGDKKEDRDCPSHKKDHGRHQPPAPKTGRDHVASRGIFLRQVREPDSPRIDILQPVRTKVVAPGEGAAVSAAPGQIAMAPVSGPGDRKGRPIEQIIHSIEPLIEDSVPRTEAAPAVPEPVQVPPAEPSPAPATRSNPRQMLLQPRLQPSQRQDRRHRPYRPSPRSPLYRKHPGRKAGEPSRWRLLLSSSSRLWAGDSC